MDAGLSKGEARESAQGADPEPSGQGGPARLWKEAPEAIRAGLLGSLCRVDWSRCGLYSPEWYRCRKQRTMWRSGGQFVRAEAEQMTGEGRGSGNA